MSETRTLVVERMIPHPPEKIWRALTQARAARGLADEERFHADGRRQIHLPHPADAALERRGRVRGSWPSSPTSACPTAGTPRAAKNCRPPSPGPSLPSPGGTRLRLEQSGFEPQDDNNYKGAAYGWQRNIEALEKVVAGLA